MIDRQDTRYLAAIAGIVTLVCAPLFLFGPQSGHSLPFNMTWTVGFAEQLLAGDLYPRWLPGLNEGAGSPAFFYYAPVPFYMTSLGVIACGGCGPTVQIGLGEWLMILLSAGAFYAFARQYGAPMAAAIGALLYALMPYHFIMDVIFRQAIGEAAAYIWIPLIVLFTDRLDRGAPSAAGLAATYALLVLTHLPTALLFSMFLLCYAGFLAWDRRSPRLMAWFAAGVACGVALSGIYLVTALNALDLIWSEKLWSAYEEYDRWFFFGSKKTFSPDVLNAVFQLVMVSSVAFAAMWYATVKEGWGADRVRLLSNIGMVAGAWFLMLPISGFVWIILPFLQKVQFPWRVAVVIDFAIAATVVTAVARVKTKNIRSIMIVGCIGILPVMSVSLAVPVYMHYAMAVEDEETQARLANLVRSGVDAPEYIPANVTLDREELLARLAQSDRVDHDRENGEVMLAAWASREITLDVDLTADTQVTIRQFFFSGWSAKASDGRPAPVVSADDQTGLVVLRAPAGRYRIELTLDTLWQESLGFAISLAGLLGLAIFGLLWRLDVRRGGKADPPPAT